MSDTRTCQMCGIDITDKRATAKTCSPKCRKDLSRIESVTPNVTLSDQVVTLDFEFYTQTGARDTAAGNVEAEQSTKRKARYWYDVPLAAIPVIKSGWPKMPDTINGRQYFLWWKNEFATSEDGTPVILNPLPVHENVKLEMGGESSRKWGA